MKRRFLVIGVSVATVAALSVALALRRPEAISAESQLAQPQTAAPASVPAPRGVVVPKGTKLHIRLEDSISTKHNNSGDRFSASLDGPLAVGGKLLAPSHSKVLGQLTEVKQSGRIKGRAQLTMVLTKLITGKREYDLHTEPLTFTAPRTWKRDAYLLAGSSALGAVIGAIAGGGKGAAIGAGIGGGAGTGWWLTARGAPVAYGPETRLTFTLAQPVRAPVQHKAQRL